MPDERRGDDMTFTTRTGKRVRVQLLPRDGERVLTVHDTRTGEGTAVVLNLRQAGKVADELRRVP